jgi:hypothetical protein
MAFGLLRSMPEFIGLRFLARTCTVSGMANVEQVPVARYTRRVVFLEEPRVVELIERWADEGATSQASILRLALRQFFKDQGLDDVRVG